MAWLWHALLVFRSIIAFDYLFIIFNMIHVRSELLTVWRLLKKKITLSCCTRSVNSIASLHALIKTVKTVTPYVNTCVNDSLYDLTFTSRVKDQTSRWRILTSAKMTPRVKQAWGNFSRPVCHLDMCVLGDLIFHPTTIPLGSIIGYCILPFIDIMRPQSCHNVMINIYRYNKCNDAT